MAKHILAALVENRPGVLARVSNLFRRRSFNIDSLSVGRTQHENLSRMTIVMESDTAEADRLVKNLYKLVDVVHVDHLHSQPSVARDMALVKVKASSENRREVIQLCDIFRARIIDVAAESLVVEITGEEEKLGHFTELVRPFGIVEMVRTGVIAMGRGSHTLKDEGYKPNRGRSSSRRSVL
ncbi:MAG: acetolactate synthase small subunit [Acidobacteria bacterium]|nr:acetolactate synthase small subunit [Acidobacteriota bacterium]